MLARNYGVASALVFAGGVIILATAFITALTPYNFLGLILTVAGLATGGGVILGGVLMRSGNPDKVKRGSIIAVVFGIASIIAGAGFIIGLVLSTVGGLMSLVGTSGTNA